MQPGVMCHICGAAWDEVQGLSKRGREGQLGMCWGRCAIGERFVVEFMRVNDRNACELYVDTLFNTTISRYNAWYRTYRAEVFLVVL